jgi:TolB-like protein
VYNYHVRYYSARSWSLLALFLVAARAAQADPLESVAKRLAKAMARYKKDGRVAVLVFPYENGNLSSGSSLVSEHLTSLMAGRKHVNVVERSRISELLGEMRLEESGVTESTGAPKAGGILGVDAVVTGTLSDSMEGETEVNARLIRIETGEILAAATTRIERDWQDQPHCPAPPPGTEEDDDSHYVMHASPLIYTPSGRRGTPPPPAAVVAYAGSYGREADSASEAPSVSAATVGSPVVVNNTTVIVQPSPRPYPRPRRSIVSAGRAQMLYALGATLDVQGDRRQAARFYRQARKQNSMPAAR